MKEGRNAAWAGAGAGLLLGILFKIVQALSGHPVYTLLLTVDYVPILNRLDWPEWAAFALHLIIAALIGLLWRSVCRAMQWRTTGIRLLSPLLGLLIGTLLMPTANLSELTPHALTVSFALWWLLGHLAFGIGLGLLLTVKRAAAYKNA